MQSCSPVRLPPRWGGDASQSHHPLAQPIALAFGRAHRRSRPVYQYRPQVRVASLADPKLPLFATRAVLFGGEPQRRRHLSAVGKLPPIAHRRHQRRGNDRSDSAKLLQPSGGRIALRDQCNLAIEFGYPLIEQLKIAPQRLSQPPKSHAQAVPCILQPTRYCPPQLHQLPRSNQPILRDQAADLIAFGRALLDQPGATRCTAWMSCCSTVFTATNRIFGRLIASQIASASLASFLLLCT